MAKQSSKPDTHELPPAISPRGRESQLKAAALDLAEQKIKDGTASSQLLTLVLKMDHRREERELELLEYQIELTKAKRDAIKSGEKDAKLYQDALDAFKRYAGVEDEETI